MRPAALGMNILFIHQNMPGQFKHLAPMLARRGHSVRFLTQRTDVNLLGVGRISYKPPRKVSPSTHPYLQHQEMTVLNGQQVARALLQLRRSGFTPDLIIGHPGWGELLYVKDILPNTRVLSFCEFYYRGAGLDVGFDPEFPADIDSVCKARSRGAHLLLSLESCDVGVSPTHWQRSVHPFAFHDKIEVIFDGIDPAVVSPNGEAEFGLPDGTVVQRGDEVVTYVSRQLEPYRGFHIFMRALPHIMRDRPNAKVVIVGEDGVSYGAKPAGFPNWREKMLAEVDIDPARVYFLGRIPYSEYLKLLRVSAAHVYLTYPFVLSWSCLEAMSVGALVIASDTAPVAEVIRHNHNGILADFFNHRALAAKVVDALEHSREHGQLRVNARETVLQHYALQDCLKAYSGLISRM